MQHHEHGIHPSIGGVRRDTALPFGDGRADVAVSDPQHHRFAQGPRHIKIN